MKLTLRLTSRDPAARLAPETRVLDRNGLTFGRGPDNDWVLEDAKRVVSKSHCFIDFVDGQYRLTDTSANGVFVNRSDQPLGRSRSVVLNHGDVFTLGDYEVAVALSGMEAPSGVGTHDVDDPFAARYGADLPLPTKRRAGQAKPGMALSEQVAEEEPTGEQLAPALDPIASRDDNRFSGSSVADHVPAEQVYMRATGPAQNIIPEDWDLDLGGKGQPAAKPGFVPPRSPPRPAAAPPGGGGTADAGLAAFLRGAGIAPDQAGDAAAVLQRAGQIMRALAKGLRETLAARATVKGEFRIEQTTIGPRENNPLKFANSLEEGLTALLIGGMPGFTTGPEAATKAFDDVKAHQLAVMAGMQAALAALLKRFDPEQLRQRFDEQSPKAGRGRYWEMYETLYQEIAREADDDFQAVFGRDFAEAYRQQIEKL